MIEQNKLTVNLLRTAGLGLALSSLLTDVALGNVVGSDAQNFNPTTGGVDFVTVQSSETLEPGIFNLGLFFNHAVNTLPYFNVDNDTQSRARVNDSVTSADLHIGVGLMTNWELGLSLPHVISQKVESNEFHGQFGDKGNTEVRLSSKIRLWGTSTHGIAVVGTANINRMKNNPFLGADAGPIYGAELAGDFTVSKVAFGVNVGHRWRRPGEALAEFPIEPLGNQMTGSVAASYMLSSIDTKVIVEAFGSLPTEKTTFNSDRALSSAEGLIGLKHDASNNLALHFGGGTELGHGLSSPDWRLYAGMNWTMGPVFSKPKQPVKVANTKQPVGYSKETKDPFAGPVTKLVEKIIVHDVLFEFDSDHLVLAGANDTLKRLSDYLKMPPVYKRLVIEGHTCAIGDDQYNKRLSLRRAQTIRRWMIEKYNLDPSTIEAAGLGESTPIAENNNFQGRQLNRRVEFRIYRK